jgi:hypothetical protein
MNSVNNLSFVGLTASWEGSAPSPVIPALNLRLVVTWNLSAILTGEFDFIANSEVGSLWPRDKLTLCFCTGICRNSGERTSLAEDSADRHHNQNEKGPQQQIESHSS